MTTTSQQSSTIEMHQQVLEILNDAKKLEKTHWYKKAIDKYNEAFKIANEAARLLKNDVNAEPIRSVMYWHAGCIALKLNNKKEAFNLAVEGKRFATLGNTEWCDLEDLRLKCL